MNLKIFKVFLGGAFSMVLPLFRYYRLGLCNNNTDFNTKPPEKGLYYAVTADSCFGEILNDNWEMNY